MILNKRDVFNSLPGLILALFSSVSAHAFSINEIDQSNPGPYESTNGSTAPFSFGQSFTPSLTSVNSFEFLLGSDHGSVHVNLLEGMVGPTGLEGMVLAQSPDVTINTVGSNLFTFTLPAAVELVPGQTYVAELVVDNGSLGVRHTDNQAYSGGQYLEEDLSPNGIANEDLVFAEGLSAPVPEPTSWVLMCLAVPLLLRIAPRRSLKSQANLQ